MADSWFDESYYLSEKAEYNNSHAVGGITTWTVSSVSAALASAGLTAEQHYLQYGWTEGLVPNQYYNQTQYVDSKVAQLNANQVDGRTNWTAAEFEAAWGGNPFLHYVQYGAYETGVEPSSGFNDDTYYADKATYNNTNLVDGRSDWTAAEVKTAFQAAGLTPIGHYELYGQAEGFYHPTPVPVPGQTYTLTIGADTVVGTIGDDTIVAGESSNVSPTLTAGDNINGAEGTNTINVSGTVSRTYSGFTMQNVQIMNVTADDNSTQTFDLSGTTGLKNIASVNSTGDVVVQHVANLVELDLTNLTGGTGGMYAQFLDSAVSGSDDSVSVVLNNTNAGTIQIGSDTDNNGGIETVNITATGANSLLGQLDTDLTTLNFAGDKNLTITTALNTTVKTIDASTATGGLTVSTDTPNALSFTGGSGADQITFASGTLTAADSVIGGAGSDRLVADQADLEASSSSISGMEIIRVQDELTGTTFDASNFTDATNFELAGGYNAATIQNLAQTQQEVDITGDSGNNTATTLTIDDGATSATDDAFTIGLGTTAPVNVTANVAFTSNEIETLNLVSNGSTKVDGSNTINVTDGLAHVATLNVSGNEDVTVSTVGSQITTVDASTATGGVDLLGVTYKTVTTGATGATITLGSGNDTVSGSAGKDTIICGAGADSVIGTSGADTITLGDGKDTVYYNSLSDSSYNATDTITDFASKTDVINLQGAVSGLTVDGYKGNYSTFALSQGALTGNGEVSAVFQQDSGTLWVDLNGDGTLDANDLRVNLTGVTTLDASSVTFTGSSPTNSIVLDNQGDYQTGNAVTLSQDLSSKAYKLTDDATVKDYVIGNGYGADDNIVFSNVTEADFAASSVFSTDSKGDVTILYADPTNNQAVSCIVLNDVAGTSLVTNLQQFQNLAVGDIQFA